MLTAHRTTEASHRRAGSLAHEAVCRERSANLATTHGEDVLVVHGKRWVYSGVAAALARDGS
jgi:hypothetical protein